MTTIVSIVVATMNRPKELDAMLSTLFAQSCLPDEVIVVDQSSDSLTKHTTERYAHQAAEGGASLTRMIYVHASNLNVQDAAGAGVARNIGIDRAAGDVLVFLDDDVLLEREFLGELISAYNSDEALGGVSGIITNYPRPSLRSRLVRRLFWVGPFHDERQPIYWNAKRLRQHKPIRVRKFGSGVMSVRRAVLKGDRFDQGGGSGFPGEDIDLSWRISEHSPLVIAPRARLLHIRSENARYKRHWLSLDAQANYYLYQRRWKDRFLYKVAFMWLNVGYAAIASAASLRRFSSNPWQELIEGCRRGCCTGRQNG